MTSDCVVVFPPLFFCSSKLDPVLEGLAAPKEVVICCVQWQKGSVGGRWVFEKIFWGHIFPQWTGNVWSREGHVAQERRIDSTNTAEPYKHRVYHLLVCQCACDMSTCLLFGLQVWAQSQRPSCGEVPSFFVPSFYAAFSSYVVQRSASKGWSAPFHTWSAVGSMFPKWWLLNKSLLSPPL